MTTDDPRGREVPHGGQTPHECGDSHVDVEWPALASCPFCGGHVDESNVDANAGWWVECPTCATLGPFSQSEREAIEAWERRALVGDIAERVRDLQAQLAECDAAPVTDARIWDSVRARMVAVLIDAMPYSIPRTLQPLAAKLTTIALGEREEADHG